jgi:hypothetical protein
MFWRGLLRDYARRLSDRVVRPLRPDSRRTSPRLTAKLIASVHPATLSLSRMPVMCTLTVASLMSRGEVISLLLLPLATAHCEDYETRIRRLPAYPHGWSSAINTVLFASKLGDFQMILFDSACGGHVDPPACCGQRPAVAALDQRKGGT